MHVITVGADVRPKPGLSCSGRIVARFSSAAHVALDDGRLLTLLCGDAQHGMRTINLREQAWPQLLPALIPGSRLRVHENCVEHSGFRLNLADAIPWKSPRASEWSLKQTFNLSAARSMITLGQHWLASVPTRHGLPANVFWQAAHANFTSCVAALLAAADDDALGSSVCSTIGLGPGLTPSGDDMLCGLLIGLAAGRADTPFRRLAKSIRTYGDRAPFASRDALDQACLGWLTARLYAVLDALRGTDDTALVAALVAQEAVGHSSGFDSLIGLFAGLEVAFSTTITRDNSSESFYP